MTTYDDMPLDRLRWLQTHGSGEARTGARKALEARLLTAKPDEPATYRTCVTASDFGTPRPEIQVKAPAARNRRELYVVLHEVAARVERALAGTREAWHVELRRIDEREGAVYLELMDGTQREVDRAMAALQAVTLAVGEASARPVRRRSLQQKAAFEANVEAAMGLQQQQAARVAAAGEGDDVASFIDLQDRQLPLAAANDDEAMPPAAVAHERLGERLTGLTQPFDGEPGPEDAKAAAMAAGRDFRKTVGNRAKAIRFEQRTLKRDRAELPTCAQAVLDGADRDAEYWAWMRTQFVAAQLKGAE